MNKIPKVTTYLDDDEKQLIKAIEEDNYQVGIQMVRDGTISGNKILIKNHPIAFNIQRLPDSYEFNKEVTGLIMIDNIINFDSQELDVPEIIDY